MTAIPDTALIPAAEEGLQKYLQEIPETVTLPESMPLPTEVKWPVRDATSASAVVAALQNRRSRIAQIQEMAKTMVAHEETEIRRLQFAVGGYTRKLGDKVKESWGTLEQWAKEQVAMRRDKSKFTDTPFGRLSFRAASAKAYVPEEKMERFAEWCLRTGHTELIKVHTEVRLKELLAYMQNEKNPIPTDEDGVVLVEHLQAGRYDNFIVGKEVES